MLGRLVERMKGNSRPVVNRGSFLDGCLERVRPRLVEHFLKALDENPHSDCLDLLSLFIVEDLLKGESCEPAAARAFFSVLLENEHLPLGQQLSDAELTLLRDLLMGYFKGNDNVNEKGAEVLSLIERKFMRGEFSQARILLQIFETDEETRQNNERNLFYEEMITRLSLASSNAKGLPSSVLAKFDEEDFEDAAVNEMSQSLANESDLRFCLFLKDQAELAKWHAQFERLQESSASCISDYVPVARWRRLGTLKDESISSQVQRHMTFEMLRRHVQLKLRMCYFLLLASGKTGVEWFIFSFSEWSLKHFNVEAREVLPFVHRSSVMEGLCLQEVMDIAVDRFFGPSLNKVNITKEQSESAWRATVRKLSKTHFASIPRGYYNLGDFILDELLPFEHVDPLLAYKLYLLM
ncbi:MAG: hypothetical protein WC966_09825 [Bradymonadales bacterium]